MSKSVEKTTSRGKRSKAVGDSMAEIHQRLINDPDMPLAIRNLARKFQEDEEIKKIAREKIDDLGLPRYHFVEMDLEKALELGKKAFESIGVETGKYYTNIRTSVGRIFELNQSSSEVIKYMESNLAKGIVGGKDRVTISEYWPNTYGANLIINEDGSIYFEMIEGEHSDLAYSKTIPALIVSRPKNTCFIDKYNWENKAKLDKNELNLWRELFFKTIKMIPTIDVESKYKHNNEPDRIHHPGYYEIIYSRYFNEKDEEKIVIKFLDYRDPEFYKMIS